MPDVLQARRPEQSIGDRVTEDIRIGVTRKGKSLRVAKRHAAKYEQSLRI
jgi:hypothetical protein